MRLVEIACFVEEEHAQLAARFLRRHGIKTTVPAMYFRWKVNHPHRVFVRLEHADKAAEMFRRVAAGEFSDENPLDNTPGGLGAALAEAVLPRPGFRPPTRLERYGPFILLALAVCAVVLAQILRPFFVGMSS